MFVRSIRYPAPAHLAQPSHVPLAAGPHRHCFFTVKFCRGLAGPLLIPARACAALLAGLFVSFCHRPASELLLVCWGLFFIATRPDREPKMKARNFTKSVAIGKEIVMRRRSLSVDSAASAASASQAEERPRWDPAYGGSNSSSAAPPLPPRGGGSTKAGGTAAAVGFRIIPPGNGGAAGGSTGNGDRLRGSVSCMNSSATATVRHVS